MNWIEVLKMPSRGKARKLFFAEFKQAVLDVFEDKDKISNIKDYIQEICDRYLELLMQTQYSPLGRHSQDGKLPKNSITEHVNRRRRESSRVITPTAKILLHNGWVKDPENSVKGKSTAYMRV